MNTSYWPTGAVKRTWGSRTYPVEYTYDPQGRVKTLTTWQNFATTAGAAVTTWNYHAQRGWLENKRYNDNTGPAYTYKSSGRLQTRVWARTPVITTTYGYNAAGDLEGIAYDDATPDVSMTYDRLGRPKTMTDGSGARTLAYHTSGQLKDEDYTSGVLNTLGVHRTYDAQFRLESVSALSASSVLNQVGYSYDAASRLDAVTSGTNTATYGYVPDSPLTGSIVFKQGGTTRLTTIKTYDFLNRLSSISSQPSALSPQLSHAYDYNSANQRTRTTREDNARWDYTYDALGQVTSGKKVDAVLTPLAGHDFEWTYDDIGNRKTTTVNSHLSTYTSTLLNTYSQRTVPGAVDVMGSATVASTVTLSVNSGATQPTVRQGELFYKQLTQATGSTASVKVTGVRNLAGPSGEDAVTEITRTAYVPATPEAFAHDTDGNLTSDAQWAYTWDGENRLIGMETSSAAVTAGVTKQKLEFAYDGQGRRFEKKVYNWNGTAWVLGTSTRFLYEGWNLLAELDAMNSNATVRTYVWGLDLSGSMQGAGGVGGLLFSNIVALGSPLHAPCFDGNGNVIGLVDMATGAMSATYEYNAFGETLIADGVAAVANTFRFSTKYTDAETGLLYYGLRYYSPGAGRWLSRDPIEESGGLNIHAFAQNDTINKTDALGLALSPVAEPRISLGGSDFNPKWGAHTRGSWPSTVASLIGRKTVKVEGELIITITTNPKLNLFTAVGSDGRTMIDHEKVHVGIHKKWWMEAKRAVDPVEGEYCRSECAQIAKDGANAAYAYAYWNQVLENGQFDWDAYGHKDAAEGTRIKATMTDAWNKREIVGKQLDQLESAWRNAKCSKTQ